MVNSWEEALNELVEEKRALREALDNIVMEWEKVGGPASSLVALTTLMAQAQRISEEVK